jgi:hypothetical protein
MKKLVAESLNEFGYPEWRDSTSTSDYFDKKEDTPESKEKEYLDDKGKKTKVPFAGGFSDPRDFQKSKEGSLLTPIPEEPHVPWRTEKPPVKSSETHVPWRTEKPPVESETKATPELPYVSGKGKPHGYKTYALLKTIKNLPDGIRYTDMVKFLLDYERGEGAYDRGNHPIKTVMSSGPYAHKYKTGGNWNRGYWATNLAKRGFFREYIQKDPETKRWKLNANGELRLEKLEKKFGNL